MIALPVCRWRQELTEGRFLCTSAKYCDPPNTVAAKFCAKCTCADHEPPPPLLRSMPCVHLGGLVRENGKLRQAADDGARQQFACALHGSGRTDLPDLHRP